MSGCTRTDEGGDELPIQDTRDDIARRIAQQEARLLKLDAERDAIRRSLAELRGELTGQSAPVSAINELSPLEKVAIYRSYFRGRSDLYARRWVNERDQRHGYAAVCSNEWVDGLCEKPKVPCGSCPNSAFMALDDRAVIDHLQGRQVVGLYPMQPDQTCRLVAADLGGEQWKENAHALMSTAVDHHVPCALERSRSGEGAHLWIFFQNAITAREARELMRALHRATERRVPGLLFAEERFFPPRDRMEPDSLGAVIALPLQHGPRQQGNTVFLDADLQPYPDPWAFLASLPRLSADEIPRFIKSLYLQREAPRTIDAVLEDRLYVDRSVLTPTLTKALRQTASFPNPEYHKKRRLRLSTAFTPQVINTSAETDDTLVLPRGTAADARQIIAAHGSQLDIDDRRSEGEPLSTNFVGRLTPPQTEASAALLAHDDGLFIAPPGTGKTVLGAAMIAARGRNALVIVHRKPLLEQWTAQIAAFLDIDPESIGRIGGGKRTPTGIIDVAMIQSLLRKGKVDPAITEYGHVIVDECHHAPARSFEQVLSRATARYLLGLTATPERRDGMHPITTMQLGPIRHRIEPRSQAATRPFDHELTIHPTAFTFDVDEDTNIGEIYSALSGDTARNTQIVDDIIAALEDGRSPLVLTERRAHLSFFAEQLQGVARHLVVLHGGRSDGERLEAENRLRAIPQDEERLVIATGRYIGEGFDDSRLDTLFLTLPISWKGTLVQYAGRLHRNHAGKKVVKIHDYVDANVPMLARMFERRRKGYRSLGYRELIDT